MTREEIIEGLRSNYGIEFGADVKGFCAMNDIGYSTVTKKDRRLQSRSW